MKRIGFIDYYLDEWHANNYPQFFTDKSGGNYKVTCAYGKIDSPVGGITNKQWAEKYNVTLYDTIEQVIENSDCLIVLSPDNPEMHEELSDLALKSGKPVYIDKTFTTDKACAERIFHNADVHNTRCFSTSALRFSSELSEIDTDNIDKIYSEGPGTFDIYLIHQVEPIIMLMKTRVKRVMFIGENKHPALIIEFKDGRTVQIIQINDESWSFKITTVDKNNQAKRYDIKSDYFGLFIEQVIKFFDTGIPPVSHTETIDVIAVIEAGRKAIKRPFEWIDV